MNSNNIMKFVNEKVNTEDLILEVERQPAVWNSALEEYGSKLKRRNAWHAIVVNFIPDFDEKPFPERKEILSHIQRKWKGIRTCYARELQKKKRERNESAASGRKQYVYFESLRFLETVPKQPAVSTEEGLAANFSLDNDNEEDQGVGQEVQNEDWEPEKRIHRQSRKRTSAENYEPRTNNGDDAFIHVFKKILQAAEKSSCEKDEDRFFLLSLVSELHKVPPNKKLKLKSEIINAIFQAQQT